MLLRFDTTTANIPAGATIVSATLIVTLKFTNAESRTVSAFDVTESGWVEANVTWNNRTPSSPWSAPGATLGSVRATANVGTTVGAQSIFDVTSWVQTVVTGQQPGGSRWTRLALVDEDATGSSATYKEFHSEEANVAREQKPKTRDRLSIERSTGRRATVSSNADSRRRRHVHHLVVRFFSP